MYKLDLALLYKYMYKLDLALLIQILYIKYACIS